MAEPPRRPTEYGVSTPTNPRGVRTVTGRQALPPIPQPPREDPRNYPAARDTGDMAAVPSIPAELSAVEQLMRFHEQRMAGQMQLALDLAVGSKQSREMTISERHRKRNGTLAITFGTVAGTLAAGMFWAILTYKQLTKDTADVVAPVVEAKVDPIEKRVASTEDQVTQLGEDVNAVGRKVEAQGKTLAKIIDLLEANQTPQARKRPKAP